MQPRVIAIVAARRGGEPLQQTLDALAQQSRRPDLLVVVDAAGSDAVTAQLAAANPTQFVTAASGLGFGELVHRALGALPAAEPTSSPYGGVEEWLWLLRHDTVPDPRALERLLAAVEIAPSVAVAGPKQMDAAQPTMIAGYGETLTRLGASIAIAERELDQAQHDRTSDVLAVGEAAMLVRRTVFAAVEGFDPALPGVDAALDLCVRIRLAGHRVVGVPQARVFVHESTAQAARPGAARPVSDRLAARLRRTAQLHRRLVYAPSVAVPLHWLGLLPLAIARALAQLLRKQPGRVGGEFTAALAVAFSGTAVPSARRRLARARTVGWAAVTPLRMEPDEVRRRRAVARDAALSAVEDDRPVRPDFLPGGAWVVVLAAVVGAVVFAPLLGAPALLGGALAPLAPDAAALLEALRRTGQGAADPFTFVLAGLGGLTAWQPSLVLGVLWVAAVPLAALGGWWAAAALVKHPGPAAVAALLWALSPALLSALANGRPAAVIAHLALPLLVAAAARAPRSWSATAVAGLTAAVVVASAPALLPALVLVWVVWMLTQPRRIGRLLTLAVPTAALLGPLAWDQLRRGTPLGLLASPGLPVAPPALAPTGILAGWPDLSLVLGPLAAVAPALPALGAGLVVAVLALPAALIALAGLALPTVRRALLPLALAALGVTTAWAVGGVAVSVANGAPVLVDAGPALSLAGLGIVLAAAVALEGIRTPAPSRRVAAVASEPRGPRALAAALGAVLVVAAVLAAVPAVATIITEGAGTAAGAVRAAEPRTLPALVAAEAQAEPGLGTIVLRPTSVVDPPGAEPAAISVSARIDRGAGRSLVAQRSFGATAPLAGAAGAGTTSAEGPYAAAEIAALVANLVAPSGQDASSGLATRDIRFVLLEPAAPGVAESTVSAIVAALDGNAALASVGDTDTGRLWRVVTDDDGPAPADDPDPSSGVLLGVQLGILGLTLLLAVPTSIRPRRPAERTDPDGPAATFEPEGDDD
ncbi:glycosyltransferase [Microcella frigidaquae]|uniref:GT2 family glycosyltransferase n=1 Tax=Microcella frigidaquae TaxID=424758 RepID=A0A840XJA0_9MICO|nr:GT2 family glycosyltransferase [Microcella frigidaquae]NHN43978.1 glycosyltransferase family 2 protein [Microcella frigidaquae]